MKYLVFLLGVFSLISCSKTNEISGLWIEANSNNPSILKFWDNKYTQFDFRNDTVKYRLSTDSIYYETGYSNRFIINKDTLCLSFRDSINFMYLRFEKRKYYDFFIDKLNVKIDLPMVKYKSLIKNGVSQNIITLSRHDSLTKFSFNGQFYNLDSFKLKYEEKKWRYTTNLLLIDSGIKYQEVYKLEKALGELDLRRLKYVVKDSVEINPTKVYGISRVLKVPETGLLRLEFSNPHEMPIYPPPPPKMDLLLNRKNNFAYIELYKDSLVCNGKKSSWNNIEKKIFTENTNYRKFVLGLFISEDCSYSEMLNFYSLIYSAYRNKRELLSNENYNQSFEDLSSANQKNIKRLFPRSIKRLSIEELNYYINTP